MHGTVEMRRGQERILYRAGVAMRGLSPGPKRIDFDDDTLPDAMRISSFFPFFSLRGAGGGGHHIGGRGQKQWHSRVVGIFLHLACGGDFAGLLQPMKHAKSSRQRSELLLFSLIFPPPAHETSNLVKLVYFRISPSTTLHIYFVHSVGEERLISFGRDAARLPVLALGKWKSSYFVEVS